ncbi:MAG TPA: retropepsin-like aspartic protease [Acidobacteriaceae bacterium]|jgi:predicted aspartyl protease
MKRTFARVTITLAAVVLLLTAGRTTAHAESEIRLQLVRGGLILVPVTANDDVSLTFLLDTGADRTIVDTAVAKRLSLTALEPVEQLTVTGNDRVNVGTLAKLAVGGVQVDGLPVLEEDLSGMRRMDRRIVGILGQDFLSRFNYLLDYRAKRLRIEESGDLREALEGEAVPLDRADRRMMVAAEAEARGQAKLRLLLDSGATSVVLMGQRVSTALHCPMLQPRTVMSTAGAAATRMGRVDLTVAAQAFRDVAVALVETPVEGIGDGLLPMALFDAVYVNNAQGYVVVNPRERKMARAATMGRGQ